MSLESKWRTYTYTSRGGGSWEWFGDATIINEIAIQRDLDIMDRHEWAEAIKIGSFDEGFIYCRLIKEDTIYLYVKE